MIKIPTIASPLFSLIHILFYNFYRKTIYKFQVQQQFGCLGTMQDRENQKKKKRSNSRQPLHHRQRRSIESAKIDGEQIPKRSTRSRKEGSLASGEVKRLIKTNFQEIKSNQSPKTSSKEAQLTYKVIDIATKKKQARNSDIRSIMTPTGAKPPVNKGGQFSKTYVDPKTLKKVDIIRPPSASSKGATVVGRQSLPASYTQIELDDPTSVTKRSEHNVFDYYLDGNESRTTYANKGRPNINYASEHRSSLMEVKSISNLEDDDATSGDREIFQSAKGKPSESVIKQGEEVVPQTSKLPSISDINQIETTDHQIVVAEQAQSDSPYKTSMMDEDRNLHTNSPIMQISPNQNQQKNLFGRADQQMGRTTPVEAIETQSKLQIVSINSINEIQPQFQEPPLPVEQQPFEPAPLNNLSEAAAIGAMDISPTQAPKVKDKKPVQSHSQRREQNTIFRYIQDQMKTLEQKQGKVDLAQQKKREADELQKKKELEEQKTSKSQKKQALPSQEPRAVVNTEKYSARILQNRKRSSAYTSPTKAGKTVATMRSPVIPDTPQEDKSSSRIRPRIKDKIQELTSQKNLVSARIQNERSSEQKTVARKQMPNFQENSIKKKIKRLVNQNQHIQEYKPMVARRPSQKIAPVQKHQAAEEEEEFMLDSSISQKNEDDKCPKVDTSDEKSVSSLSGVGGSKSPMAKSPARHKQRDFRGKVPLKSNSEMMGAKDTESQRSSRRVHQSGMYNKKIADPKKPLDLKPVPTTLTSVRAREASNLKNRRLINKTQTPNIGRSFERQTAKSQRSDSKDLSDGSKDFVKLNSERNRSVLPKYVRGTFSTGSRFGGKSDRTSQSGTSSQPRTPRDSKGNQYQRNTPSVMGARKVPMSKRTEKILLQKFNKEFIERLKEILECENLPIRVPQSSFIALLRQIGCINSGVKDGSKDNELVREIWQYLIAMSKLTAKDTQEAAVNVGDTKLFLMAILGIKGNKRMGLEKTEEEASELQLDKSEFAYGWINKQMQLCLTEQDSQLIYQRFSLLRSNRHNFKRRPNQSPTSSTYSFKPNLAKSKASVTKALSSSPITPKPHQMNNYIQKQTSGFSQESYEKELQRLRAQMQERHERQRQNLEKQNQLVNRNLTFRPNIEKSQKRIKARNPSSYSGSIGRAAKEPKELQEPQQQIQMQKHIQQVEVPVKRLPPKSPKLRSFLVPSNSTPVITKSILQRNRPTNQTQVLQGAIASSKFLQKHKEAIVPASKAKTAALSIKETVEKMDQVTKNLNPMHRPTPVRSRIPSRELPKQYVTPKTVNKIAYQTQMQPNLSKDLHGETNLDDNTQNNQQKPKKVDDTLEITHISQNTSLDQSLHHLPITSALVSSARIDYNPALGTPKFMHAKLQSNQASSESSKLLDSLTQSKKQLFEAIPASGIPPVRNKYSKIFAPVLGESSSDSKPLLFIDIDIGDEDSQEKDRITVYKGDVPLQLAKAFCEKHDLDLETRLMLEEQLKTKIAALQFKQKPKGTTPIKQSYPNGRRSLIEATTPEPQKYIPQKETVPSKYTYPPSATGGPYNNYGRYYTQFNEDEEFDYQSSQDGAQSKTSDRYHDKPNKDIPLTNRALSQLTQQKSAQNPASSGAYRYSPYQKTDQNPSESEQSCIVMNNREDSSNSRRDKRLDSPSSNEM